MELEAKHVRYSKECPARHPYFIEGKKKKRSQRDQMPFSAQQGYLRIDIHFHKRCKDAIQSCSEHWGTHYPSWDLRAEPLCSNALSGRQLPSTRSQPLPGGLSSFPGVGISLKGHHSFTALPMGLTGWGFCYNCIPVQLLPLPTYFHSPSFPSSVVPENMPHWVSCMYISISESASQGTQPTKRVYAVSWENVRLRNTWINLT